MPDRMVSITLRIPEKDRMELEAIAHIKGLHISEVIRNILHNFLYNKGTDLHDSDALKTNHDEVLKYLKRILYHCYRIDAWEFEYTRRVHNDKLADELHQDIEELVDQHSKS